MASIPTPSPAPIPSPLANTATTEPSTATSQPAGVFERNVRLGRGVNLGNALEAPDREGEWGVLLNEDDFRLIREAGFNSVRVPIRWSAHAGSSAPFTIDPLFMKRIDWVVDQAFSNHLVVVIDMHHYEDLMSATGQNAERFVAMWRQIAEHYQARPNDLYMEPYNEPHDITSSTWNDLLGRVITTIRTTNLARPLVVGPLDWYRIGRLTELQLPADDANLIVSFHYYEPFQFTHQGAEWVQGSDAWMGNRWQGTPTERAEVDRTLDNAVRWAAQNHRPLYMGEFGAYSKADMDSRARWTAYLARAAEARHISWAYWEFRAGFGVYDSQAHAWRAPLKQALVPKS